MWQAPEESHRRGEAAQATREGNAMSQHDQQGQMLPQGARETERITPLLAGMDTVYFSCDLPLSDAMRERLTQEKTVAPRRELLNARYTARSGWKHGLLRREPRAATHFSLRPRTSA
jgi:hypothetical protein